ncbi:GHKL domain-containing protein [Roseomonas nepalensis]|uniref:histidine kinase n=1 Tax=Muricoccus nepalensis TaxID=1854500 RepID=A0A502G6C7_9PROT|nr:ATP-binding protein [Roseomonas nepalensis]TPG57121.1 GHKL domain-containing protein [Roseomonas nepalensis]
MGQVFSRWPSAAPPLAKDPRPGPEDLPAWMLAAPARPWPGKARDLTAAGLLVLAPAALAALGAAAWPGTAAIGLALLAAAAAALAGAMAARTLAALKASEERFASVFERAGISLWREDWSAAGAAVAALRCAGVSDIESHFADHPEELRAILAKVLIKDVNAFTLEETGAPDKSAYVGPLDRLLPPTDQTFVQWLVAFGRGERHFRSEAHIACPDGTEIDTLFTARLPENAAGFSDIVVASLDITEFKRAQARLAAAEVKLARTSRIMAFGAVSASIAHEVNTPLAAITANAQAALRWLKRPAPNVEEAVAALEDVASEAARARDVVARTRSFFGEAAMELVKVDLVRAAREANLFAEAEIRAKGATVHLTAEPGLPPITGDLVQIQQVFVNLLVNAAQAMAGCAGRRDITVGLQRRGEVVCVTVSDTGPGIEPAQRAQVFEPFHSTKPGGMGVGLAICRACIDSHGGDLWVEEAPGGGAAFRFTLPI